MSNQYPAFEGGQTLTAQDLNLVRSYHHQRDRLLGRLVGFGINCGLRGTVSGSTLTISPGLAIDQVGEPLVLSTARTIVLPPEFPDLDSFDFVSPGPGYSVVLEATDTVQPAPDCGKADCDGHAELHTRDVALRVVTGRITRTLLDFANEPLLAAEPLRLSSTSAPQGSYVTLRDTLVTRLTNSGDPVIDKTLIAQLQATTIAGHDLPGVKGYKAGFINQVLFSTLDLLRCRSLNRVACDRPTERPGVVLGWIPPTGFVPPGNWTPGFFVPWLWDCRYRHSWEPPSGFVQALTGGTCSDLCGIYRDRLEGIIAGYAPPDPPPTPPPAGGKVIDYKVCTQGEILIGGKCVNPVYPSELIPEKWSRHWHVDPRTPIWNPPVPDVRYVDLIATDIYQMEPVTFMDGGVINVTPALGYPGTQAKNDLEATIKGITGSPNVALKTAVEVTAMEGYRPAGSTSPSDLIVLTVDSAGSVVATGRVAATRTGRTLGTELPAATGKANQALAATIEHSKELAEVTGRVDGIRGEFNDYRKVTGQWQGQVDASLAGVGRSIELKVQETLGTRLEVVQGRLATVEGSVDVLKRARTGITKPTDVLLDPDVTRGLMEFAATLTAGLSSLVTTENERTLGRNVAAAARAAAKLEAAAVAGEPATIGDAALALLGTIRTAVKSASGDPQLGKRLDAQFNVVKDLLR